MPRVLIAVNVEAAERIEKACGKSASMKRNITKNMESVWESQNSQISMNEEEDKKQTKRGDETVRYMIGGISGVR